MRSAGLLLTGGASTRMGRDKATIAIGSSSLAARTAEILQAATSIALEVGPGHTGLDRVVESEPGRGPLSATVEGWKELGRRGWIGPLVVVATDLPNLTAAMLAWVAEYEPGRSVVPVAKGRFQPLCARYEPADLEQAALLVASGRRAMADLVGAINPIFVPDEVWAAHAGDPDCLADVDTPDDLGALRRCSR